MRKIAYALLPTLMLLAACMTPAVRPDKPELPVDQSADSLVLSPAGTVTQEESLDPFLLPDAELVFRPREVPVIEEMQPLAPPLPLPDATGPPAPAQEVEADLVENPEQVAAEVAEQEAAPAAPQLREGFQVQLFASTSKSQADEYREQALYLFPGESVNVVWDAPNYKVRVGMFARRDDADVLRRQALRLGYRDAWIVRSRVEE